MQPDYKTKLLSGKEKPSKMVTRKKEEFEMHAEKKKE